MTHESGGATAEAQVEPLTPGRMLRRERERRALSVQQAAEDLHLDASTVEAIEADRFVALGAPVYAKGHLRKYAALLGLSPADVIQRYEALTDTPVVADPIPTTVAAPAQRTRPSLKVPIWLAIALILAAAAAWLYQELSQPADEPVYVPTMEPEPAPIEAAPEATSAVDKPAATTAAAAPTPAPARTEAVAAEPAPASTEAVPDVAPIRLRLEFNESSWAEITDATGRRLMFDTGSPGHVRTFSGVPPIRINLGLASAVVMQVNDRSVVVPRREGKDSARFAVDANGVTR